MSPLALLILASLVAAAAFFLAGLLLAPPRAGGTPDAEPRREGVAPDHESLQRELTAAQAALAEAREQHHAAEAACQREQAERQAAERERDNARERLARLSAGEKTLAERLRAAEDENRAAFKREEEAAEMWAGQLDAAKSERKRHDQVIEREVEGLHAELAVLRAERERLAAEASSGAAKAAAAAADAEKLQARAAEEQERGEAALAERERFAKVAAEVAMREREALERLAAMDSAAQAKVAEVEAAWRAKLAEAETTWRAKLAEAETTGTAKLDAALAELQRTLAAAETERQALRERIERGQAEQAAAAEANETLGLRVLAAEEVAEQRRLETVAAVEARKSAEGKLKDYERLVQENSELRAQQAEAEHAAKEQAGRQEEAKDAKVELAAAQAKLDALAGVADENRRLRDEVAELRTHEAASGELERLQAAHKQVRLDAELMARRLQELLHERAELGPLRAQAAEAAALAQEVEYLRRREKDLEAQLYASGSYASRELPSLGGELPVVVPGSDLETNLSTLVGQGGPRTAVLADTQGFLIAAAGEGVAQEGLAAYAAVAGEMVARARMLLPLADIESVRVTDANRMVLTCHLFTSAGTELGVTTLGPGEPQPESTTRAIAGLAAIVSGGEKAKDEEPST
jgi:hypothetical protein